MRILTRRAALLSAAAGGLPWTVPARAAGEAAGREGAGREGLADYGAAPEFAGISGWLNSPPLTMAGLRGKVVLIDFWTYSCINCLRTLPYVTRWYDSYRSRGLVVVGVHTPEFGFERSAANVRTAIERFGIRYPVAQDNGFATWHAYDNQFWPAEYLVDRDGRVVLKHFGEGRYDETENAIRSLLAAGPAVAAENGADLSRIATPEMYFGLARVQMLASPEPPRRGAAPYTVPVPLPGNRFALMGTWNLSDETATLAQGTGAVALKFRAAKVFMVASSPAPVTLSVTVDGRAQPAVTVRESRLYTLFESADYGDHVLHLAIPQAGLQAFTFTFG